MRIAHISDLHMRYHLPGTSALTLRQSRRVPELLTVALHSIRAQSPDLLVLSGDLLDYPLDRLEDEQRQRQALGTYRELSVPSEATLE